MGDDILIFFFFFFLMSPRWMYKPNLFLIFFLYCLHLDGFFDILTQVAGRGEIK